ncbi:putative transcription factor MYB family [Helianthus annuus]|nr:putative transcription factor MYB family [Helianthus annuus]
MMLQQQLANQSGDAAEASSASAAAASAAAEAPTGFSEDERGRIEDGGRNSGGNRWPRQETLALLKIRSDMDVAFRDSSLKGPLWDEVSRKLAELGYHRSAKMKREHELLVQERSMVAAKDAAVISFLQKITEQNPNAVIPHMSAMQLLQQQQQNLPQVPAPVPAPTPPPPQPTPPMQQQQQQPQQQQQQTPQIAVPAPAPAPAPTPTSVSVSVSVPATTTPLPMVKYVDNGGGGENMLQPSPSRWPKAEINALINLRKTLDTKYQESGPKGPLWEEISSAMRKLGYNRNAKRCKEKWENINKYYKKVKESSKKRPEDSKTCPYFHQLDAIYREKASGSSSNNNSGFQVKPETQVAIMARPEQQWPLPAVVQEQQHQHQHQHQHQQQHQQSKPNEPRGVQDNQNAEQNDDDYDEDDDDDEEEGGDYEIVPNKTSSMATS